MDIKKSESPNPQDYEIMIRKRGDANYAAYCPQLNLLIKGDNHELVHTEMKNIINKHCDEIQQAEQERIALENPANMDLPDDAIAGGALQSEGGFVPPATADTFELSESDDDFDLGLDSAMGAAMEHNFDSDDFSLDDELK